jgi:molecular chaperone HtpG
MVAEEIEILTSHKDEQQARRISINGPSGTYLIKLVDKQLLKGHFRGSEVGTRITLSLRAQSKPIRLVPELRYWFGFPGCDLVGTVDDEREVKIGYQHPGDLLVEALDQWRQREKGLERWSKYSVVRHDEPGQFQAAYVIRTSVYGGGASLAFANEYGGRRAEEGDLPRSIGIFLQGVRVEAGSPGFRAEGPLAVVNGIGRLAPRTNVARSGIEQGDESRRFLGRIYDMYIEQLRTFVQAGASITKIGRMTNQALRQLSVSLATEPDVLQQELDDEPTIVVEMEGGREAVSRTSFAAFKSFETVSSTVAKTVYDLLGSLPVNRSLNEVLKALGVSNGVPLQTGILLTAPELHLSKRELETLTIGSLSFVGEPNQVLVEWKRVTEADPNEAVVLDILKRISMRDSTPIFILKKPALHDEGRARCSRARWRRAITTI